MTGDLLTGFERVRGSSFDHTLTGGSANNYLTRRNGNDRLSGGAGRDRLVGNSGDDILKGGAGRDFRSGTGGADGFIFQTGDFKDRITDFNFGVDSITFCDLTFSYLSFLSSEGNLLITYEAVDTLTLEGQAGLIMDASDFTFMG
ncbi:hypothetical protein N9P29_00830 [bacterium]|nr:hypothetical protein [bacterium]